MDIYDITIEKILVEGREKLVLYRDGQQISDMRITTEEIEFLEEVTQQYKRVTSKNYNIRIKKTLVDGKEKLVLYRDSQQISDMQITNEEVSFLEEVTKQYKSVLSQLIHSQEFTLKNKEEAMAVGFILRDKDIPFEVTGNAVTVDGIRNSKMADLYINEFKKWKDEHSK